MNMDELAQRVAAANAELRAYAANDPKLLALLDARDQAIATMCTHLGSVELPLSEKQQ